MKIYVAALIDKSLRLINSKLQKNLLTDFQKTLRIPSKSLSIQELNTFIVVSAEKNEDLSGKLIEEVEKGCLYKHFKKYYTHDQSLLQKQLETDNELQETSKIIKDFAKEVDSELENVFSSKLKNIITTLSASYQEIQLKSYITLLDFKNNKHRFFLPGFSSSVFTKFSTNKTVAVGELFDKLLIANFFAVFLNPTITRLSELDSILDRLKLEIEGTHYQSKDVKLQKKLEMFLRILAAKLSALQNIDNLLTRIFKLFPVPFNTLTPYHFQNVSIDLNKVLAEKASELEHGETLLLKVSNKLQECQICLRDYLDAQKNSVSTVESTEDFKKTMMPLAKLGVDLFVEAELLKMWLDFFGSDIPYFTFNSHLFDKKNVEVHDVEDGTIIAVRGLTKNYNLGRTTIYALRGINLDVKEGEFVAIVGNSGAGKTTLLNCMAGLDSPDNGVVLFRGQNLHKMADSSKSKARLLDMGFIFQSYALLPHFNARENIALPADIAGLSKNLKNRIENLLSGVGISNQAKQYPSTLSGGQMQRVAIARALTNRPAVIFADEPTGDLDSKTGKQVMDLLKKFHDETKTTIIVITHAKEVADYAERHILIEDGVIVPN